jgi:hypothetical protein
LNEPQYFFPFGLVSGAIDQKPSGTFCDDFENFETVFLQGAPGFDEIDDSVREPDQWRQLNRTRQRNDLYWNSSSVVIALGPAMAILQNPKFKLRG